MIICKYKNTILEKYHKEIGFKNPHVLDAKNFIENIKNIPFKFSKHSITELLKESEAEGIGKAIKEYNLNMDDVFEIVINAGHVEKLGFRIAFNSEYDIIFMLSQEKIIITAWLNEKSDNHKTLNKSQYQSI